MENQHRKIKGYNELDQDTIDLINKVKLHGLVLDDLVEEIKLHIASKRIDARNDPDTDASELAMTKMNAAEPERWVALGRTALQEGLMKLTRAIAQPGFF